jgi:hypothetical protein
MAPTASKGLAPIAVTITPETIRAISRLITGRPKRSSQRGMGPGVALIAWA